MKTIKFRGKTKGNEWVYGYYVYTYPNEHRIFGKDKTSIEVIPETVGQFTGMTDKNGAEIYEGDILGLPETDTDGVQFKNRFVRVVEWVNDGFFLIDNVERCGEVRKYGDRLALEIALNSNYAGIASCLKKYGDYAVIGNIYENGNLLKK